MRRKNLIRIIGSLTGVTSGSTRRAGSLCDTVYYPKFGFTLAEVLITLGIIGVVAAMTMPALVGKYKKAQTVSQLKKVYSTLSQGMLSSVYENGDSNDWVDTSLEISAENSQKYFNKYWKPYLKIIKVCETPESCGYSSKWVKILDGSASILIIDETRTAGFLADGTFLSFVTVNWGTGLPLYTKSQSVRADLNGPKPPNVIGKDIFVFSINLNNNSVKPACFSSNTATIKNSCKIGGNGECCLQKIVNDNWTIKDDYPW